MIYVRRGDVLNYCSLNQPAGLNENIPASFITSLVRHPGKTKLNDGTTMYCPSDSSKFFGTTLYSKDQEFHPAPPLNKSKN